MPFANLVKRSFIATHNNSFVRKSQLISCRVIVLSTVVSSSGRKALKDDDNFSLSHGYFSPV
jgi:hypothetical protein